MYVIDPVHRVSADGAHLTRSGTEARGSVAAPYVIAPQETDFWIEAVSDQQML